MPDTEASLRRELDEMCTREREQKGLIDDLTSKLNVYRFEEAMRPVAQRLTQTPYSRRVLGDAVPGTPESVAAAAAAAATAAATASAEPFLLSQSLDLEASSQRRGSQQRPSDAAAAAAAVVAEAASQRPAANGLRTLQDLAGELQRQINLQMSLLHAHDAAAVTEDAETAMSQQLPPAGGGGGGGAETEESLRETVRQLEAKVETISRGWNESSAAHAREKADLETGLSAAQEAVAGLEERAAVMVREQEAILLEKQAELEQLRCGGGGGGGDGGRGGKEEEEEAEVAAGVRAQLGSLEQEVAGLRAEMAASVAVVASVQGRLEAEGQRAAALEAELGAARVGLEDSERAAGSLAEKLEQAAAHAQELTAKCAAVQAELAPAQEAAAVVPDLRSQLGTLHVENKRLNAELASAASVVDKQMAAVKENEAALLRQIEVLQEREAATSSTVSELEVITESLKKEKEALQKSYRDVQARADSEQIKRQAAERALSERDAAAASPTKRGPDASAAGAAKRARRSTRVVATLSGFRDAGAKREVARGVAQLRGEMVKAGVDQFDDACTHCIIHTHEARTVKTIAAVLTGKWVLTAKWVSDSVANGGFLDEELYGYRMAHGGIAGKTVHMTRQFTDTSERYKPAMQLIEYGGGRLCNNAEEADVVLRSGTEARVPKGGALFNNTWENFIAWVFPTEWRPVV